VFRPRPFVPSPLIVGLRGACHIGDRRGPAFLDSFRGRDKWDSAG
jgi:hypothetical protein